MGIPVIDLFAGPGGLGEGFSSVFDNNGDRVFKTVLSIEMEPYAHQTLTLRSFYRQFSPDEVPEEYYKVLRGELEPEELLNLNKFKKEVESVKREAKNWKLGYDKDSVEESILDGAITEALKGTKEWVLSGGPPCQAYSIVGRSRLQRTNLDGRKDKRVTLYKHYLRILYKHKPAVFVMENVKGILSARSKSNSIFKNIMSDLKEPGYKIYSLVKKPRKDLFGDPVFEPEDFVIRCEDYGIPQTRHRVILLGIREDFFTEPPDILIKQPKVSLSKVIDDLPPIRSGLSKQADKWENWISKVKEISLNGVISSIDNDVADEMMKSIDRMRKPQNGSGDEFVKSRANAKLISFEPRWFYDERIGGASNHKSRGHMGSDLHRYLFVSAFGKVKKRSPKLEDFPKELLPDHKNVQEALKTKKFADRFRVQLKKNPSKTITSHISKDGHYYIHYDPKQCRSLTVREAARVQTFPDNYYFCGPRTAQYVQVGNAVPPLLAKKISEIVQIIYQVRS